MSAHNCYRCAGLRGSIHEQEREIVHLLRIAQKSPGTNQAKSSLNRIGALKQRLRTTRAAYAEHIEQVSA